VRFVGLQQPGAHHFNLLCCCHLPEACCHGSSLLVRL
jgi:hypothetical protein